MKTVFFCWITEDKKNKDTDFDSFYKSFKHFHPDIEMIVFDDGAKNDLFRQKPWLNYCNCKASFAKLLYNDYDLVVNIDADFYFFDRCEEILAADYDVAACANYNVLLNSQLLEANIDGYHIPYVDDVHYMQGGLIASTSKKFWDDYEQHSKDLADKLTVRENDVFNILWHSGFYKTKVLDGDYNWQSDDFKCYYNCASLDRVSQCVLRDNKVYLNDKPMRSYHVAWGPGYKRRVHELFSKDISDWFYNKINNV